MASLSHIEWTEASWNPVTGCNKISPGCKHCYAERMSFRLREMGQEKYKNGFDLTLHPDALEIPLKWKNPKMIFVNSMSDLFHKDIPDTFILEVFRIMREARWHLFQVLTKRSDRLAKMNHLIQWTSNIWMGVSVESVRYLPRIDDLRSTNASIKFLSIEPLLEPLPGLELNSIDWVIVGGESGPGARPMKKEWVRDIRDRSLSAGIPFFFKQWGGVQKKQAGRKLDGRLWNQMPKQSVSSSGTLF